MARAQSGLEQMIRQHAAKQPKEVWLKWKDGGFTYQSVDANKLRDRWNSIHSRPLATMFYDAKRFQPSPKGVEYLRTIFASGKLIFAFVSLSSSGSSFRIAVIVSAIVSRRNAR